MATTYDRRWWALAVVLTAEAQDVTVTLAPTDGGAPIVATVAAGTSVAVPAAAGAYRLETSAAVHAAVTYSGAGALASYPLWPADAAASALTILP